MLLEKKPRHVIDGMDIIDDDGLLAAILPHLTHTVSDDSFDHAFGTEHAWHGEIDQVVIHVLYPAEAVVIPFRCDGTYNGGGCDKEHRGKCKLTECASVELPFSVLLDDIKAQAGGGWLAEYDITQET